MVQFRLGMLAPIRADLTPDNKKEASAMLTPVCDAISYQLFLRLPLSRQSLRFGYLGAGHFASEISLKGYAPFKISPRGGSNAVQ